MDSKKSGDLLNKLRRKSLVILLFLLGAWLTSAWFVVPGNADVRVDVGNLDVYVYVYDLKASKNISPDIVANLDDLALGLGVIDGFDYSGTDYVPDNSDSRVSYFYFDPEKYEKRVLPVKHK